MIINTSTASLSTHKVRYLNMCQPVLKVFPTVGPVAKTEVTGAKNRVAV